VIFELLSAFTIRLSIFIQPQPNRIVRELEQGKETLRLDKVNQVL
jgi:hypothetical protein